MLYYLGPLLPTVQVIQKYQREEYEPGYITTILRYRRRKRKYFPTERKILGELAPKKTHKIHTHMFLHWASWSTSAFMLGTGVGLQLLVLLLYETQLYFRNPIALNSEGNCFIAAYKCLKQRKEKMYKIMPYGQQAQVRQEQERPFLEVREDEPHIAIALERIQEEQTKVVHVGRNVVSMLMLLDCITVFVQQYCISVSQQDSIEEKGN